MSPLHELSTAVRTRRAEIGMTQGRLAELSGLSRATVNEVETGRLKDLSLTRTARLLDVLGLSVSISAPHPKPGTARSNMALEAAARTASVSYKTPLTGNALRKLLLGTEVPAHHMPHLRALLDEAPISLLARVVEQIHAEEGVGRAETWSRMRDLAQQLKVFRRHWQ